LTFAKIDDALKVHLTEHSNHFQSVSHQPHRETGCQELSSKITWKLPKKLRGKLEAEGISCEQHLNALDWKHLIEKSSETQLTRKFSSNLLKGNLVFERILFSRESCEAFGSCMKVRERGKMTLDQKPLLSSTSVKPNQFSFQMNQLWSK
jgi:hypothetical protein